MLIYILGKLFVWKGFSMLSRYLPVLCFSATFSYEPQYPKKAYQHISNVSKNVNEPKMCSLFIYLIKCY